MFPGVVEIWIKKEEPESTLNTHQEYKMSTEIKDIPGYEGIYSINKYGGIYFPTGMSPLYKNKKGILRALLKKPDQPNQTPLLSVLVATAFVPNPDGLEKVRHIDGNLENYYAGNLEWFK